MKNPKFLQIHILTSYPGTLLNRDDAGFAKRLPFGGAVRTRISSQCLKYHWRHHKGEHSLLSLDLSRSIRSRETFNRLVAKPLIEEGYPPSLVTCAVMTLMQLILSDSKPSKKDYQKVLRGEATLEETLNTSQVTIFGEPEIKYLKQLSREVIDPLKQDLVLLWEDTDTALSTEQIDKACAAFSGISKGSLKKNLKGLALAAGLDAAMFGRMATSDVLARGDAAIHVAHAFTTHAEETESDYFSAVDELKASEEVGELGSGHINSSELTSGLFYGYVVVDVPLLVSNLEGCNRKDWEAADHRLAADVIERFIPLVATVSPGAKLGSTAPYAYSECVLVESGSSQPRTLANAFREPVSNEKNLITDSYRALGEYVHQLDQMYGATNERCLSAVGPSDLLVSALRLEGVSSLSETAKWASAQVRG